MRSKRSVTVTEIVAIFILVQVIRYYRLANAENRQRMMATTAAVPQPVILQPNQHVVYAVPAPLAGQHPTATAPNEAAIQPPPPPYVNDDSNKIS